MLIRVSEAANSSDRVFLSANNDGTVDFWDADVGSGSQHWLIEDAGSDPPSYTIKSLTGNSSYLSTGSNGKESPEAGRSYRS